MKPAIYLSICLAVLSSCSQGQTLKDDMIQNYLKEDFVFMEDRLKHEMVVFESRANENPEKYGAALDMSRSVSNSSHKYIFVNEIIQNGKPTTSIKYKAATNTVFGEITLDSLPPANYEIRGQVRGVAANDRYYEEDFSYSFDIK